MNFSSTTPQHRELYDQLVSASVHGTPEPKINKSFKLTDELSEHVLQTLGKGTDSFNPNDRAVQQVEMNRGRTVHSDALHPAILMSLGHRSIATNHPNVHIAALTSSNHPTVADTWMNAAVMGQPQATAIPENYRQSKAEGVPVKTPSNVTSIYKQGGTNLKVNKKELSDTGYMRKTSLASGEPVLDVPNRNLEAKTIQHAINDKILRTAAGMSGQVFGTGVNMPSVSVQESIGWTVPRAVAGKDKTRKGTRGN